MKHFNNMKFLDTLCRFYFSWTFFVIFDYIYGSYFGLKRKSQMIIFTQVKREIRVSFQFDKIYSSH